MLIVATGHNSVQRIHLFMKQDFSRSHDIWFWCIYSKTISINSIHITLKILQHSNKTYCKSFNCIETNIVSSNSYITNNYYGQLNLEGLNIDLRTDILRLTIFEWLSHINLFTVRYSEKVKSPGNLLQKNTKKNTNNIYFHWGRPLKHSYSDNEIKIVNTYIYLEIIYKTSALFSHNAKNFVVKYINTTDGIKSTFIKDQTFSWDIINPLFDSIVAHTLLYTADRWERISSRYLKRTR